MAKDNKQSQNCGGWGWGKCTFSWLSTFVPAFVLSPQLNWKA